MISIIEQPTEIALSRNPNVYRLTATDSAGVPYGAKGASAFIQTNANGFVQGDTLVVEFTDPDNANQSVTFSATSNPISIGEIKSKSILTTGTNLAYFQTVAAQIEGHPLIAPYFTVTATQDTGFFQLLFVAREAVIGWSITLDVSGVDAGSNATTGDAAFEEDNTPDAYKVLLDIYVEQTQFGSDYELAATLESIPDSSGATFFDISSILHAEVVKKSGAYELPIYASIIPKLANTSRRYYIRYREDYTYTGIIVNQDLVWKNTQPTRYICGLSPEAEYLSERDANSSIITDYPNGKFVARQSPEYLNWYNWTTKEKTVVVQYETTTETGDTDTPNVIDRTIEMLTVPAYSVGTFPVGVQQLGISDLTAKKYRVRIIDYADSIEVIGSDGVNDFYKITPYSEWRTYYIDDCYHLEQNHLIYYDTFRLPHVVRCVGDVTQSVSFDRQVAERIILNDTPDEVGQSFQYSEETNPIYIFRTGYLSRDEVLALQTMLRVNEIWKVGSTRYAPLLLTKRSWRLTSTRQYLHALDIEVLSNENPTSLTEELPVLSPLLSCEFNIIGAFADDTAAASGGVGDGDHYYLSLTNSSGLTHGQLIELNPAESYRNDAEAVAALPPTKRCYALAQSNDYGMKAGTIKVLTGYFETYKNDTEASGNTALSTGDTYPVARRNPFGLTEAIIKVIT